MTKMLCSTIDYPTISSSGEAENTRRGYQQAEGKSEQGPEVRTGSPGNW